MAANWLVNSVSNGLVKRGLMIAQLKPSAVSCCAALRAIPCMLPRAKNVTLCPRLDENGSRSLPFPTSSRRGRVLVGAPFAGPPRVRSDGGCVLLVAGEHHCGE